MARNLLECLPRLTEQQVDRIILALAASRADYRALPREQLKQERVRCLGFLFCEEIREALIDAVSKGHLTIEAADEIACKIGAPLGDR